MDDQVIKMTKKKIEDMKELGALFIFTSGAAFNVANNKYLKTLFKDLRLPVLVPNRKTLSQKYLPLLFQRVKSRNELKLKGKRHRLTLI